MFEIVKDYRDNNLLRSSFNQLAIKTFGLDFEDWYENGYWRERYIPYSVLCEDEIVANVSIYVMDFVLDGKEERYIQLSTVMTKEEYRNQGLIRKLIEEIENDYTNKVDGFFLFANNSVLDFYPKFGYKKEVEFQYKKQVAIEEESSVINIQMSDKSDWQVLEKAIKNSISNSRFETVRDIGLIMFYVTKFMKSNVYYSEKQDAYIIAEVEDEVLVIHNVFAKEKVNLDKIIGEFGKEIEQVILGFTPLDNKEYSVSEVVEDDCTLFVKGISDFLKLQVMFPTLSHA